MLFIQIFEWNAGEKNGGHYFVASQDLELRRKLGNIVGGATLFISVNGVHISQPTDTQRALAAQAISHILVIAL